VFLQYPCGDKPNTGSKVSTVSSTCWKVKVRQGVFSLLQSATSPLESQILKHCSSKNVTILKLRRTIWWYAEPLVFKGSVICSFIHFICIDLDKYYKQLPT